MLTIDKIADGIKKSMDSIKAPAKTLPPLLLFCTAVRRSGLSASRIASKVITNNAAIGIPTGVNPDGSPNLVNEYTYNIVKTVIDAISDEGVVHVVIPAGSLMIQATGANAGGPVTCVGTNITDTISYGLIT